eukprot:2769463-Prymnesium_polylepis.1
MGLQLQLTTGTARSEETKPTAHRWVKKLHPSSFTAQAAPPPPRCVPPLPAPRHLAVCAPPRALAQVRIARVPPHLRLPESVVVGGLALLLAPVPLAHIPAAHPVVADAMALRVARLELAHKRVARRKVDGALSLPQARLVRAHISVARRNIVGPLALKQAFPPPPHIHVARRQYHRAHALRQAHGIPLTVAHQLPLHHLVAVGLLRHNWVGEHAPVHLVQHVVASRRPQYLAQVQLDLANVPASQPDGE